MQSLYTHALLGEVLNKLTDYGDLIICSAVCRAWRSTSELLHPRCLVIPGGQHMMTSTVPVLEWLQRKQHRDRLDRLESLTLELHAGTGPPVGADELARFGQSIIVLAGFWQLQRCCLDGNLDLAVAGCILPVTLQHLTLLPQADRMPTVLHLSMFERFTSLQSLVIDMCDQNDWLYGLAKSQKHFALDAVLPSLTHLYLGMWPLRPASEFKLVNCLPFLQHVVVYAHAQEVKSLLKLPYLKYCGVVIVEQLLQPCQLIVTQDSQLMKLVIHGTLGNAVLVEVLKSGVQLLCRDSTSDEYISYVGDTKQRTIFQSCRGDRFVASGAHGICFSLCSRQFNT